MIGRKKGKTERRTLTKGLESIIALVSAYSSWFSAPCLQRRSSGQVLFWIRKTKKFGKTEEVPLPSLRGNYSLCCGKRRTVVVPSFRPPLAWDYWKCYLNFLERSFLSRLSFSCALRATSVCQTSDSFQKNLLTEPVIGANGKTCSCFFFLKTVRLPVTLPLALWPPPPSALPVSASRVECCTEGSV